MSKNHTVYHLHDTTSNCNGYADSCSGYQEYIKLAKQQNMHSIAFSNHGGIFDWVKKKQDCDKAGIKYIHGIEHYVCKELSDDDRGGHIGLYARNYAGVLELNSLYSISTSKGIAEDNSDRHMYYNPRISLDELMNTSSNIIITTACLASPLNRWSDDPDSLKKLVLWLKENKDRCFLEIQYHNHPEQIAFNQKLYQISKSTGIPLIAGTDTHSSSNYKAECRTILQKYKKSFYGEEDSFDLTWKTYDELVEAFNVQNALPEEVYLEAIENTNTLANMVEGFELDKSFKYPDLYGKNVNEQWKQLIYRKLKEKQSIGALDLKNFTIKDYKDRIKEEFSAMCKQGMQSFMMFMSELVTWCWDNGIPCGIGRGSVGGSMIAYITDITDVDALVWKTVFSRFCNADRISLADIDIDFAPEDRTKVYEYIIKRFTPQKTAYIAAFSTLQDRGCIDVLAGGLGYSDLDKVAVIKDKFDEYYEKYGKIIQEEVNIEDLIEDKLIESSSVSFDNHKIYQSVISNKTAKSKLDNIKKQYDALIFENQDLFYYLKGLKGTIVAKGNHPAGIIGSPITLSDNIGVFYKDGNIDMPISVCAMKAVDSLNYVKFDILGLKSVGIIKDACKYAGIPYPKSYQINWEDQKVWDNMIQTKQAVVQFEVNDYSFSLLRDFKPSTINHMSMVNAALRPAGKSYRERLISGEFNKNPSEEIDNLLKENNGFLIFQEDTIRFLTDICDFSGSEADNIRRYIGKKLTKELNESLPKILDGYCKHSSQPRKVAEEEARQFLKIVEDSSNYQFNYAHSTAYSMNGYISVMLRTYYTIELVAAYLNRAENKVDINNGIDLARFYGIEVYPIKYGKSLAEYVIDHKNKAIYKGIASIKYCNSKIADELMELSKTKHKTFVDLLVDLSQETSVDARQLDILIRLGFFEEFGKSKYLLDIVEAFNTFMPNGVSRKQINKKDLDKLGITEYQIKKFSKKETASLYKELDVQGLLNEIVNKFENKSLSIIDVVKAEKEYLEYVEYKNPSVSDEYYIVVDYTTYSDSAKPYVVLRNINNGEEVKTKIKDRNVFIRDPFGAFSILKIKEFSKQFKSKQINGKWQKTDELEDILEEYAVMKK